MRRTVKPGDPFKGNITAKWFNEINRIAQQRPTPDPTKYELPGDEYTLDEVDSVTTLPFRPIMITDVAFNPVSGGYDDTVLQQRLIKCKKPASGATQANWGITQDEVVGGMIGKAIFTGLTWAYFELVDEDHKYVKLDTTSYTLKSTAEATKATIISFTEIGSGLGYGMILISGGAGSSLEMSTFTLSSDLASTTGATATSDIGEIVNTGLWRAFSGATGLAVKLNDEWFVVHVNEPGDLLVILDASATEGHYGADPRDANATIKASPSPVMLTQYPHCFNKDPGTSVPNPLKLYGEDGDTAIIKWNRTSDAFYVAHVIPAQQRMFWGELSSDIESGLVPTVEVTPTDPLTPGTIPTAPVNVVDLFDLAHNAKDGDRCLVIWDNNVGGYKMLNTVHTTTRFLGELDDDFDETPATFTVDHIRSYNGNDPDPATAIEVENRWNWVAGVTGKKVEIWWDPTTETWYPNPIECPDDPTPTYF